MGYFRRAVLASFFFAFLPCFLKQFKSVFVVRLELGSFFYRSDRLIEASEAPKGCASVNPSIRIIWLELSCFVKCSNSLIGFVQLLKCCSLVSPSFRKISLKGDRSFKVF